MSIAALRKQWIHENGGYFCKSPPPSDDDLRAHAEQRIAQCNEAEKNLTPPTLIGYGLFVGDGPRTIADSIADVAWARDCWQMALACPDDRPPLHSGLLRLARGSEGPTPYLWIDDEEVRTMGDDWYEHPSPLGELVRRLDTLRDRFAYTGSRSTAFKPAAPRVAALIQWRSQANLVEVRRAARWGCCPDWSSLASRLSWARGHAGLNLAQVAQLMVTTKEEVLNWEAWWKTGAEVVTPTDGQVAQLAELYDVRQDFLTAGVVYDLSAHPELWAPMETEISKEPNLLDLLLTVREAQP